MKDQADILAELAKANDDLAQVRSQVTALEQERDNAKAELTTTKEKLATAETERDAAKAAKIDFEKAVAAEVVARGFVKAPIPTAEVGNSGKTKPRMTAEAFMKLNPTEKKAAALAGVIFE